MTNKLVSFCLITYNQESYIADAINGAFNQDYDNLEIIISDDGSTDRSESIILDYQSKNPKIVYVKNETNIKLIETLNKGVRMANGKYIVRMDADDISLPTKTL